MAEMEPPSKAPTPRLGLSKLTPMSAIFGAAEVRSLGFEFRSDAGMSGKSARSVVVMVSGMVLRALFKMIANGWGEFYRSPEHCTLCPTPSAEAERGCLKARRLLP